MKPDDLIGHWNVSDVRVEMEDVPPQLIENAKTLALATTYEFKSDMSYCMTISKNHMENGSKQMGTMVIESRNMTLKIDTLLYKYNGNWTSVEKNDYNGKMFSPTKMIIEKRSKNRFIISQQEEGKGTIYYTLDRIK